LDDGQHGYYGRQEGNVAGAARSAGWRQSNGTFAASLPCFYPGIVVVTRASLQQIYEGITEGTLVHPAGDSNFGFDPIFKPNGSDKTLAQDKPDSVNARAKAVSEPCVTPDVALSLTHKPAVLPAVSSQLLRSAC
jgi:hypothetical protein